MALPPSYNNPKDYISDCLNFLKSFSWLYNYQNTLILVNRILNHFPYEWVLYFKNQSYDSLNRLLEGEVTEDCPENLKNLINKISKLKPNVDRLSHGCNPKLVHNSGLSRKKLHEIVSLAPLIDNICRQNGTNIVIDVGSGLGYLSHLLHDNYQHCVLGIDCSAQYVNMAYKNQNKFYPISKHHVKFAQHYIDENSSDQLATLLEKNFPHLSQKTVCISGLHACADLSITILDLFTKLDFVKCLAIMPCCYHRIQLESSTDGKEYFKHFPASKLFKDLFKEFEAERFITRPFLRLACQQTIEAFKSMTTEEHERHSRSCMYRAILEAVVQSENCRVKRLKRKSGKSHNPVNDEDFQAYLNNLKNSHQLEYNDTAQGEKLDINDEKFQRKMIEKWNEHKNDCYLVEVLTGFQAALQSICENIVLLDRVEFLKERGLQCSIQKVTDDLISPRCYALVAFKA